MAFELPPSANDRVLTITIPKEIDPYLVKWYQKTKKTGESVNEFVVRQLSKRAFEDYAAFFLSAFQEAIDQTREDDWQTEIDNVNSVRDALGVE